MTALIRQEGLLDPIEIDAIIAKAPTDLIEFQRVAAQIPLIERPSMASWLDRFNLAGKYPAAGSAVCNDESLQNGSNEAVRKSRLPIDFPSTRSGREDGEISDAA